MTTLKIESPAPLRSIIVDDEHDGRAIMHLHLDRLSEDIKVVGTADTISAARELIVAEKPELVFLDIHLGSGHAFSLLESLEEIEFEIVFITSHEQYSLTAIKFNALDYLLKPIDPEELYAAVTKAKKSIGRKRNYDALVRNMLHSLDRNLTPAKVAVHSRDSVILIAINDVVHVEAEGNYCLMTTVSGTAYTLSRTLKELEDYLGSQSPFVRISRSTMVSCLHIAKYSKGFPCMITMNNGKVYEVARRKKPSVIEKLAGLGDIKTVK